MKIKFPLVKVFSNKISLDIMLTIFWGGMKGERIDMKVSILSPQGLKASTIGCSWHAIQDV